MEFPKRVFEYVFPADVYCQVFPPHAIIGTLQLCPEVLSLDVKVEESCVVHQHTEGTVCQMDRGLTQDLIQDGAVSFCATARKTQVIKYVYE